MSPYELRKARVSLGMTPAELGAWLGLTARTIRNLECGKTPISGPVARAVTLEIENRALRRQSP